MSLNLIGKVKQYIHRNPIIFPGIQLGNLLTTRSASNSQSRSKDFTILASSTVPVFEMTNQVITVPSIPLI